MRVKIYRLINNFSFFLYRIIIFLKQNQYIQYKMFILYKSKISFLLIKYKLYKNLNYMIKRLLSNILRIILINNKKITSSKLFMNI